MQYLTCTTPGKCILDDLPPHPPCKSHVTPCLGARELGAGDEQQHRSLPRAPQHPPTPRTILRLRGVGEPGPFSSVCHGQGCQGRGHVLSCVASDGTHTFSHLNLEPHLENLRLSPCPHQSGEAHEQGWALHRAWTHGSSLHPPPRSRPQAGGTVATSHSAHLTLASRQRAVSGELGPWQSIIAALVGRNRCCWLLTLSWSC